MVDFDRLLIEDLIAQVDDPACVFCLAGGEDLIIDRVVCDGEGEAYGADGDADGHCVRDADDCADVGHDEAHSCTEDDSCHRSEGEREDRSGLLDLSVECLEFVKLGDLLFGVLSANVLRDIFFVVSVHNNFPFGC